MSERLLSNEEMQENKSLTDVNASCLEQTISTIHSVADDCDDDKSHMHEIKRERDKHSKHSEKKKSILHTYPVNHTATSEASKKLITKLKNVYKNKVLPIEQKFNLYNFCLPTNAAIQDSEFDAKPMVLLIGQYSTGKTTFVRHLIGRDFPSMHIGPEPTTDRFTALLHGSIDDDDDGNGNDVDKCDVSSLGDGSVMRSQSSGKVLKGNSLTVLPDLPFSTLATFGSGFLSHFVGSISNAPLLQHVTLIDTPGVLSGEKQRLSRSYDFAEVTKWFADRSDLILLLFDGHKLDISDELKDVVQTIRPNNDDKMRCVLNKADVLTREQLVRVYGSLLWSMGKIFHSPEVVRVYAGSFWEKPLMHEDFKSMFESDESLLIDELVNLPKSCTDRKVNEVVKRIRIIKVHVCILSYLKKKTPKWFGKKKAMDILIDNLEQVFDEVKIEYKLSPGDFPDVQEFRDRLLYVEDFSKFVAVDKKTLQSLDDLITIEIPSMMIGATALNASTNTQKLKINETLMKTKKSQDIKYSKLIEKAVDTISEPQESKIESKSFTSALFLLLKFFVIYTLLFVLVTQNVFTSLPTSIINHFYEVDTVIKSILFDSAPSNNSLVSYENLVNT